MIWVLAAMLVFSTACSQENDTANGGHTTNQLKSGHTGEETLQQTIDSNVDSEQPDTITNEQNFGEENVSEDDETIDLNSDASEQPNLLEDQEEAIQVVADPESLVVLVNKQSMLPDNYEPSDLVEPDVPFIFEEKLEKRKMRKVAAEALEELFAAAKEDGISLAAVSGYRSRSTQESLYNLYVQRDGEEAANQYSAKPGQSEHQTGLAMDVSGATGACAAQDCFADTEEAEWLAEHSHEYGFIIRYPEGKEEITGYQYEPWHLRYVGVEIATTIYEENLTLEEYIGQASPVNAQTTN